MASVPSSGAISLNATVGAILGTWCSTSVYASTYGVPLSYVNLVTGYYNSILNRPPDAGGLLYWVNSMVSGADNTGTIANSIANSALAQAGTVEATNASSWKNGQPFSTAFNNSRPVYGDIKGFLGQAQTSLSWFYRSSSDLTNPNIPTSGQISMSQLYGAKTSLAPQAVFYTASGYYTTPNPTYNRVNFVMFAGGGGGGSGAYSGSFDGGGGGGAGGVLSLFGATIDGTWGFNLILGGGGPGAQYGSFSNATQQFGTGQNGGDSTLEIPGALIRCNGGGGGGGASLIQSGYDNYGNAITNLWVDGRAGGSGGGGQNYYGLGHGGASTQANQGITTGWGNRGGDSTVDSTACGGGGGAGGPGYDNGTDVGGASGGVGKRFQYVGVGPSESQNAWTDYCAGGGGHGGSANGYGNGGLAGGAGGGGAGGAGGPNQSGSAGTANTGGGGGGGGAINGQGGNGGGGACWMYYYTV